MRQAWRAVAYQIPAHDPNYAITTRIDPLLQGARPEFLFNAVLGEPQQFIGDGDASALEGHQELLVAKPLAIVHGVEITTAHERHHGPRGRVVSPLRDARDLIRAIRRVYSRCRDLLYHPTRLSARGPLLASSAASSIWQGQRTGYLGTQLRCRGVGSSCSSKYPRLLGEAEYASASATLHWSGWSTPGSCGCHTWQSRRVHGQRTIPPTDCCQGYHPRITRKTESHCFQIINKQ
jgi:hypothetical protein